jgi:predicted metal-dependent phosphoesterase TrpH
MLKTIFHVHAPYSTGGYHNPESILKYAKKRDLVVELLAHNNLVWTKYYPEVHNSPKIITGIELGFKNTDIVATGENLTELVKDKRFPVFDRRVKRMLDISLEEGLDILREIGVQYIYAPHSTFIGGAAKNGHKSLLSKVDAIECFNGSVSFFPPYNWKALSLAEKLGKTKIAGADGHLGLSSLESCYNLVDANSKEEIYEAVRKGKVEPHISRLYPVQLARDYGVLTFLALKDILNSKLKISVNDLTSLAGQLY